MGGGTLVRAQGPDETALIWNAPAGCPDASAVLARVRRQIAQRKLPDQPWRARAQLRRHAGRYRMALTLYWQGGESSREVEAVSCDALADAASILISLALADPVEPKPEPEPEPEPGPGLEPESPPPSAASAAPAVAAAPSAKPAPQSKAAATPTEPTAGGLPASPASAWHFRYGLIASLRLDLGMLPQQPAVGLAPRVLLQLGPLQAVAGLTWWLTARSQPDNYPSARLEGSGLLGDLVFGFELLERPLRLAPCLVFEHGRLRVRSTDVAIPDQIQFSWTAAGGGVRASVPLGANLHAGLELLGLAPWSRQRLLLRTPGGDVPLFVSAALALRISAELAYVFE
jgi:hypothetical protein